MNNYNGQDNRSLYDVFSELQDIQNTQIKSDPKYIKKMQKQNKATNKNVKINSNINQSTTESFKNNTDFRKSLVYTEQINSVPNTSVSRSTVLSYPSDLKLPHIVLGFILLLLAILLFFPTNNIFIPSYAMEDSDIEDTSYELNRHSINIQDTLSSNTTSTIVKQQLVEERDVNYITTYTNIPTLPKGEEIVTQEGIIGRDKFSIVQTFEDDILVEEIIFDREVVSAPTEKLINLGTSEFLAKHSVHLNDTMYLTQTSLLKKEPDSNSENVAEIKEFLDVALLDLPSEEWCKVSFDGIEGFLETSDLTSAISTPSIVEQNRIQEILLKVNIDMQINKPSGLTLNDYKKIFTDLPEDEYNVFENNYQAFYNAEKKYNINGIVLAAIGIHESNWGTSQISLEKHNLFGYGSYDSNPYEASFDFDTYADGIDTVARSLVKYYINPPGTIIYDGEIAVATYYNGPTLMGVNERYATDENWYIKVYNHVEELYGLLK